MVELGGVWIKERFYQRDHQRPKIQDQQHQPHLPSGAGVDLALWNVHGKRPMRTLGSKSAAAPSPLYTQPVIAKSLAFFFCVLSLSSQVKKNITQDYTP